MIRRWLKWRPLKSSGFSEESWVMPMIIHNDQICTRTMVSHGPLVFVPRKEGSQVRDHVRRLIERRRPDMRLIGAEFIADGSKGLFVNRRAGGVDHFTGAPRRRLRRSIFMLQTIHVPHDHLLSLTVLLHKHGPVEAVL